jgi:hypothetical protein
MANTYKQPIIGRSDALLYAQRQARALKANNAKLRRETERLRQEIAQLQLRAPMNDVLLVIMRLCRENYELLSELLDRRVENIKVTEIQSPHIKYKQ